MCNVYPLYLMYFMILYPLYPIQPTWICIHMCNVYPLYLTYSMILYPLYPIQPTWMYPMYPISMPNYGHAWTNLNTGGGRILSVDDKPRWNLYWNLSIKAARRLTVVWCKCVPKTEKNVINIFQCWLWNIVKF